MTKLRRKMRIALITVALFVSAPFSSSALVCAAVQQMMPENGNTPTMNRLHYAAGATPIGAKFSFTPEAKKKWDVLQKKIKRRYKKAKKQGKKGMKRFRKWRKNEERKFWRWFKNQSNQ